VNIYIPLIAGISVGVGLALILRSTLVPWLLKRRRITTVEVTEVIDVPFKVVKK
jgi:hypothetical protein